MAEKQSKMTVNQVEHRQGNTEIYEEIFQIVEQNKVFFIGVSNNLVTRNSFATAEEAKAYIDSKPWELIINVACICMDMSNKQNKK